MLDFVFRHPFALVIALMFIVLAIFLVARKHQAILTGHLADGVVVRLAPHRGSKGGTSYASVIDYVQADGTKSEFETGYSSNPPMHAIGEVVRVVYYPGADKPDVLAFGDLYLFPWALFCTGVFILLMYCGFILGPTLIDGIYLPRFQAPTANPLGISQQ